MRGILTVTTPPESSALIALAALRAELGITGTDQDAALNRMILRAGGQVQAYLGRPLPRATVSEEFRPEMPMFGPAPVPAGALNLTLWPVASIASVETDGTAVDSALYRLDAAKGQLWRLDGAGTAIPWWTCRKIVVSYTGGYALPLDEADPDQARISGATTALATRLWAAQGRDPAVKATDIPGVMRQEYWVGATPAGAAGLPQDIADMLGARDIL